ncbi:IS3 family transposase [Mariniflexile gromovii]|uniref:IS3 family transposase n=1 Tax=Mariniflexile gromovii TaxID=362523 RepID=A0ABS4BTA0_9FLAO|nr:IS3 family transposase [Mariniflexile gromovii]
MVTQSTIRRTNCWDYAVAESFFKTLKVELIYGHDFKTINQAKTCIFEYIEIWYNRKRLHSSLSTKLPMKWNKNFINLKMRHRA